MATKKRAGTKKPQIRKKKVARKAPSARKPATRAKVKATRAPSASAVARQREQFRRQLGDLQFNELVGMTQRLRAAGARPTDILKALKDAVRGTKVDVIVGQYIGCFDEP